jgi:hypothetical protein
MYKKTQKLRLGSTKMCLVMHHQTHLGWAIGQSGKKKQNKDPLLIEGSPRVEFPLLIHIALVFHDLDAQHNYDWQNQM